MRNRVDPESFEPCPQCEAALELAIKSEQETPGVRAGFGADVELLNLEFEVTRPGFFKDSPQFRAVPLPPSSPVNILSSWPSVRKALAHTYNRVGRLMGALAGEASIEMQAALAVWYVESGGRKHTQGRALIRFENHVFYRGWGRRYEGIYNEHFRHGGHDGEPGKAWENHKFRETPTEPFSKVHVGQDQEYRVLSLASRLAGETAALLSISIGGPQILVSNYRLIGYSTPRQMYDSFQAGERAHVVGFFDFCRQRRAPHPGDLLRHLENHNWAEFARYYDGAGQVTRYGGRIRNAYEHACALPIAG
jgi:hypothetical protein